MDRLEFVQEQRKALVPGRTSIDHTQCIERLVLAVGQQCELQAREQGDGIVVAFIEIDPTYSFTSPLELFEPLHHEGGFAVAGGGMDEQQLGGERSLQQMQQALASDGIAAQNRRGQLGENQRASELLAAQRWMGGFERHGGIGLCINDILNLHQSCDATSAGSASAQINPRSANDITRLAPMMK